MGLAPFYKTPTCVLFEGDARLVLDQLPAMSVSTAITSPPYYGLRDYGTAKWEGGEPTCEHKPKRQSRKDRPLGKLHGGHDTIDAATPAFKSRCGDCGALRIDEQIGQEETPQKFVERLVVVFDALHRVLRDDGTLWLNIGDSWAGSGKGPAGANGVNARAWRTSNSDRVGQHTPSLHGFSVPGIKAKDLIGIPWMLAFALRDAGWYLRSDIIWHKLNGMPESVKDRPTSAHEHVFLLTKKETYYYDYEAVLEPSQPSSIKRAKRPWHGNESRAFTDGDQNHLSQFIGTQKAVDRAKDGRNKRDVWSVSSSGWDEAHFATFPPALIIPCILAGSPKGGVVLDPFVGSGTTAIVAQGLGRRAIGIDLNPEFLDMTRRRDQSRPLVN